MNPSKTLHLKGSFLYKQIEAIFDRHKDEIDQISIIIPNRRAAVYIQKYLAEVIQKSFYSPEILTIYEWIDRYTAQKILSSTELLFILHEIHTEIEDDPDTFEEFILWGKTILSDFDEIDKYMLDPESVFKNLKDIKELESWDVSEDEMGVAQAKFNAIWDKLSSYNSKLVLKLKANDLTYSGRAYAQFYEKLEEIELSKHTYFIGFNAISKVEQKIMKKMIDLKIGTTVFEIDQFYFENPEHEAAHFYRQTIKEWKIKPQLLNTIQTSPKHFEVIETSQQVGQAKIAGKYVEELIEQGEKAGDIAVILADESLLIPLTKSLPGNIETANITMGWPLRFSHLKALLDIIFEFQFNYEKFNAEQLYHKTLVKFLQHPYTQELLEDKLIVERVMEQLSKSNKIFVDLSFLEEISNKFNGLAIFFTQWDKDNLARIAVFEKITEVLYEQFKNEEKRALDLEIIYQFSKGVSKLKDILSKYDVELSLRSFKMIFNQFWQGESLSFYGNPIDGLQVMGILETRTLDFKNLIIIGMNEGNLPRTDPFNSFIPRDLRGHLNLPVEEDRQAVFAHHFYRLLHGAERVVMTYNSSSEALGNSEKSRYIIQLENELDLDFHSWKKLTFTGEDEKADTQETVYHSNAEIQKRLDEILEGGLSPSALNKLINCPLDFYYRYILKFEEAEEVEENIESSTFGTKIHTVLQEIVEDHFEIENGFKPLDAGVLKNEIDDKLITERLTRAYLKNDGGKTFSKSDLKYGQNKLSFDVSVQFIKQFLRMQIKEIEKGKVVLPHHLEKKLEASIETEIQGQKKTVKFYGKADRIDQIGEIYRILDYKSGKSDNDQLKITANISEEGMEKLLQDRKKGHIRQLFMYGSMFRDTFPDKSPFAAGIISMVKIQEWIHHLTESSNVIISNEVLDLFEKAVIKKIASLYDSSFEFKHDPDSRYCQHCEN